MGAMNTSGTDFPSRYDRSDERAARRDGEEKARRVVCGADACRDADDARSLLDILGLVVGGKRTEIEL